MHLLHCFVCNNFEVHSNSGIEKWHCILVFLRLGQKEKECLLCTIRADGNGVITIKPDFNKGKEPYRQVTRTRWCQNILPLAQIRVTYLVAEFIQYKPFTVLWCCVFALKVETEGEKREVWRLTLENVSEGIRPEEKEREQRMYKDVSDWVCSVIHCWCTVIILVL